MEREGGGQGQLHPTCRPGQEPALLVHPSRSPVNVHLQKLPYLPERKCKNDHTMAHMTRRPEEYSGRHAVDPASGRGRAEHREPLAAYVAAQQAAWLVGPILAIGKGVRCVLRGQVR